MLLQVLHQLLLVLLPLLVLLLPQLVLPLLLVLFPRVLFPLLLVLLPLLLFLLRTTARRRVARLHHPSFGMPLIAVAAVATGAPALAEVAAMSLQRRDERPALEPTTGWA